MKTLYGYKNLSGKLKDPVVAIGIFDGIHIGHKRVITKVLVSSKDKGDKVLITFDPHPSAVLSARKKIMRLMSLDHRLLIFKKMGLDATIVLRFTESLASMTPEDFVKKILLSIGAKKIFVGSNFYFGRSKKGNVRCLKEICKENGISVVSVAPVKKRGKTVSSTWLRKLISSGKIKKAEELLRRPVSVYGSVIFGDKRGDKLGYPTANIDPHHEVIPPAGVYAVKVEVDGQLFDGVLNVGFKPTFYGSRLKKRKEPHIEVHLIDFKGNLYGKNVEIFFISRLRNEKKFKKEELLVRQIDADIKRARNFLKSPRITYKIKKYKDL